MNSHRATITCVRVNMADEKMYTGLLPTSWKDVSRGPRYVIKRTSLNDEVINGTTPKPMA